MSRTLRKAVEAAKHKKDTEIHLADEGVANLEDVPELCEYLQLPLGTQDIFSEDYRVVSCTTVLNYLEGNHSISQQ